MDLNTILLFLIFTFNTTIVSFIKTAIAEVIVKPLAISQGQKILNGLKNKTEVFKQAWDLLDYSIPSNVENAVEFLVDAETYIWDTILPEVEANIDEKLTTEQKAEFAQYLAKNWDSKAFLDKVSDSLTKTF